MNTLKDAGYNLLAMPRENILPGQLLLRSAGKVYETLNAGLGHLFRSADKALPPVSEELEVPEDVSGKEEMDLSVDANLSLLKKLLKIAGAEAGFSYEKQKTATLQLNNAAYRCLNIIELDEFLNTSVLNTQAISTVERLKDDDLFVITEIIQAPGFTLDWQKQTDTHVHAGADAKDAATLDSKVESNTQKSSRIVHNGDTRLTFAVKAYQIQYERKGLFGTGRVVFHIKPAGAISVRGDENYPGNTLQAEQAILDF